MTNSSKAPVKPGELENHGPRDSEVSGVEKRVKKHVQALHASVRRTVQDVWESWLREVGVHPRLAQRCMAFRRRVEKRPVSEIKSINTALRMVPAGSTIDAEFEEATSPNDGPKPKEPPAPSAGPASDSSTSRNPNGIPTGFTDASATTERADGPNSGMARLPGGENSPSPTAATPSLGGADSQADEDVDSDIGSLLKEFDAVVTRLDTVVGTEPATVTQLRPRFRLMSRTLCALASTMASCLETAGDDETSGDDVPEDLVPTLQRLLQAVDNSENRT